MDFKQMRNVHLYLGCIFTPALLFFVVTGSLQTFDWQKSRKNNTYKAPEIAVVTAEMHKHQRMSKGKAPRSKGFKVFVILMAFGFVATSVLGIVMALKFASSAVVWGCLAAGAIVPLLLLKFF